MAAKAALAAGYDSWGEGDAEDDRASGGSAMAKKRKRGGFGEDARDADPGTPGGSAQTPSRPPTMGLCSARFRISPAKWVGADPRQ